jgi:hypothetical protein
VTTETLTPADALTHAADLIERNGLCQLDDGGLWFVRECDNDSYQPGDPVDVAGALAVVCGVTASIEAAEEWLSADPPHPVVAAALAALDLPDVLALYAWTDDLGQEGVGTADQQAVGALRACAAVEHIAADS